MPEPKISGEKITLCWGFDPVGEGRPVGPWREGDRRAERYAAINDLIVVSVVGMPEIPADVSAVRDRNGDLWRRTELRWEMVNTSTGAFNMLPHNGVDLLTFFGPLTEVEETNTRVESIKQPISDTYGDFTLEAHHQPGSADYRMVLLRAGGHVREFQYPAYKVWTLLAHWTESDEVNPVEEETNDAD